MKIDGRTASRIVHPEHRSLRRREEKMFSISAMTATNPRQLKFRDFSRGNLWRRINTRANILDLQIHHPIVREIVYYTICKIYYTIHYLNYIISTNEKCCNVRNVHYGLSLTTEYQKITPFLTEASSPNYILTSI